MKNQTLNNINSELTTKNHQFCEIAKISFVAISKYFKENPKLNSKSDETINRFLGRFETKYPTIILNKGFVQRLICFLYINLQHDEVGQITLNKMFSSKSIEIWKRRNDFFYKESEKLIHILNPKSKPKLSKIFVQEEKNRNWSFNTEQGFIICIENTSLYDSESKFCPDCKFSNDCKIFQKNNYPLIYLNRNGKD